jgi:hypothetical protein
MEGKYYPSFRVDGHGLCKLEKMNLQLLIPTLQRILYFINYESDLIVSI